MEKIFNIQERTLRFGIRIVKFMDLLPKTTTCLILGKQLIRAATSIGANLEEADAAVSRRDFINKVGISMKEAYEARYWLRLIKGVGIVGDPYDVLKELLDESLELVKILTSITLKTKQNQGYNI